MTPKQKLNRMTTVFNSYERFFVQFTAVLRQEPEYENVSEPLFVVHRLLLDHVADAEKQVEAINPD